jgi:uncharacterized protein (TIGR02996 family)
LHGISVPIASHAISISHGVATVFGTVYCHSVPNSLTTELRGMQSPKAAVRVGELAKAKDPRLVETLLALLEDPPYTSGSSKKFWQAVVAALQGTNDAKARDAMLDLSTRYKSINNTVLGAWIGAALAKATKTMKVPAASSKPSKARASLDDVFAQIVAAPDDDAPRLVYADILVQKGKPRGELIVLQVDRAAGRGTPAGADREREKFIDEGVLEKFATPLLTAADAVTSIELDPAGWPVNVLARFPALRRLVLDGGVAPPAELFAHAPGLEEVSFGDVTPDDVHALVGSIASLRTLRLPRGGGSVADLPAIEHLELRGTCDAALDCVRALPGVSRLELSDETLFRDEDDEVFSWDGLRGLLAHARLARITISRFRGAFTCELVRSTDGWTFVLPCARRWVGFYEQLAALAPQIRELGIAGVTLYPEEPRHYQEPFSDTEPAHVAAIRKAFGRIAVATPDAFVWPDGEAPEEGWALSRDRACPSR